MSPGAVQGGWRGVLRAVYRRIPARQPLFELLRRIWIPPERLYRHLHFRGVFRVRGPGGGFRMVHPGSQLENELFWRGLAGWEGESMAVWRALCAGAGCVLDVGAHSGLFALVAAHVDPANQVVAFEPVPQVFRRLEENARLNGGRVDCVPAAVTDREGTAELHLPPTDSPLSASLEPGFLESAGMRVERVPAVTLDGFVAERRLVPSLIKVDVEGHEAAVLRGARGLLERSGPVVLVEVLTQEAAAAVEEAMADLDYEAWEPSAPEDEGPLARPWRPGRAWNLVLAPRERGRPWAAP